MKRTLIWLAVATSFALPVYSQPLTPEQKKGAEEVLATISKWADAVRDRDQKSLDQLFAEDLFVTLPGGQIRRKKDEMEALKTNPASRTVSITNEDVEIRMMGEAAVATAMMNWVRMRDNVESSLKMRYTAVFAKRDGRWQLVVLQAANVNPPPAAAPSTKPS
jgi:uncharacterized protein (TIGR02246 family)